MCWRHPGDARQTADDGGRARCFQRITDHFNRPGVDAVVPAVDQQISLQAVRQMKDDLAAIVLEGQRRERMIRQRGAERKLTEDRAAVVPLEVVALPIRSVLGDVTFDESVLTRDAAGRETGARHETFVRLQQSLGHVDPEMPFQIECRHPLGVGGSSGIGRTLTQFGQTQIEQDRVIQRRLCGYGLKPVGANRRQRLGVLGQLQDVGIQITQLGVVQIAEAERVRIFRPDRPPVVPRPAERFDIDGKDQRRQ